LIKKWVIGICFGHHEASAAMISEDGDVLFIREEWLSRVKNDYRFPKMALAQLQKISDGNIKTICHFQKPLRNWLGSGFNKIYSIENYKAKLTQYFDSDLSVAKDIKKIFGKKTDIIYTPHHISHLLNGSLFVDEKKFTTTLTCIMDGYGDGCAGKVYLKEGNDDYIQIDQIETVDSLALIYSAITEFLGFSVNEDEYKVMALSAYTEPKKADYILSNIITFDENKIKVSKEFFNFSDAGKSTIKPAFTDVFGMSRIQRGVTDKNIHLDKLSIELISSFQYAIQKVVTKYLQNLIDTHDVEAIVLVGGLFHNSVLIGDIEKNIDKQIIVPPSPGDAGSSLGAAYFAAKYTFKDTFNLNIKSSFIGEQAQSLIEYDHLFCEEKVDINEWLEYKLNNDEVIAVFSNRFEMGPRALLSRSLIANAMSITAVKKLNVIVKQRETFRPIAISISEKNYIDLFGNDCNKEPVSSLWMGSVKKICNKKTDDLDIYKPFLHVDSSTRPQVVKENMRHEIDPSLFNLINERHKIICNTSLNIAGDPMVYLPEDLYLNMKRMQIKHVINNGKVYRIR